MVRKKKIEIEDANLIGRFFFWLIGIFFFFSSMFMPSINIMLDFLILGMICIGISLNISLVKKEDRISLYDAIKIKMECSK